MQVYVQDYGVIDFRPEEVYRFDGRTDMTQLRGSIRVNASQDWIKQDYWHDLKDVLVAHSNDLNLVIGLPVLTRADLDKEQQQENLLCNRCGKPLSECCNKITTLKLDLEITEVCDLDIYKGDDSNLYMFNSSGDLVTSAELENDVVWDFAIGTFKLNDDKIITQTQEYHDKYYVCKNCEDTVVDENWGEQDGGTYFTAENLKQAYDTFTDKLQAAEAADDTDIEEEIQRVLSAMRQLNLLRPDEVRHYRDLINALQQLKEMQTYI